MTRPTVTADLLWRLAEHASGYYDADLQLYVATLMDKSLTLRIRRKPNDGTDYVADVRSTSDGKKMRQPEAVSVIPPSGYDVPQIPITDTDSTEPDKQAFDALFWTRASVEKFLLPYYSRRPAEYQELVNASQDANVYLIGHRKPTIYSIFDGGSNAPDGPPLDPLHTIGVFLRNAPKAISLMEYARRRKGEIA